MLTPIADHPGMICRVCGEEVRFGWRHSRPGWFHRDDPDHDGVPTVPREPVVVLDPVPDSPEVPATPIELGDPRVPTGCRSIAKLAAKHGLTVQRLTYSRGPWLGSKGNTLSISDAVVLAVASPQRFDGCAVYALGLWRDGAFEFGYIAPQMEKVNSTVMRGWIKSDVVRGALQEA